MKRHSRRSSLIGTVFVLCSAILPLDRVWAQATGAQPPAESSSTLADGAPQSAVEGKPWSKADTTSLAIAPPDASTAPNVWLTSLEVAVALGGGAAWYVIDDRNVLDWDKPSLKDRLNGKAWRFDSNGFGINFVYHPLSGAAFHALARSNNLGFWGSSLASIAGSATWEYVIEFNEKVSINDMIVTPLGGLPIGEFVHKLGTHVAETQSRNPLGRALAWTLGPTVALNDSLNGRRHTSCDRRGRRDCGCWHDFQAGFDLAWLPAPHGGRATTEAVNLRGTLVSLVGYRSSPHLTRWFSDGEVSRLELGFSRGSGRVTGHVDAETLLAGIHHQNMLNAGPRPDGVAVTAAAALGYRYRAGQALGFDDRQGLLHFPGPAVDLYVQAGWLGAELRGRASFDFAGISSIASPSWLAAHDNDVDMRAKTIVQREQYFFGWGPSGGLTLRAWAGPLWAEAHGFYGQYDSAEGLDRAQEQVTNDADLDEITTEYQYRLGVSPTFGVGIAAFRRVNKRLSYAGVQSTSVRVEELGLSVSVSF